MLRTARRPWIAATAIIAFALPALACSDDDDAGSASTSGPARREPSAPTTDREPHGAFPRSLDTALGEVIIDAPPERVVTLGNVDADIVVGMSVTPAAIVANQGFETGIVRWLEQAVGADGATIARLDDTAGAPFEAIAAADPDLIVAGSTSFDVAEVYDELSAIAPVVTDVDGPFKDTWQDRTRLVAAALGRDDEADEIITDLEDDLEARAAAHPAWMGRSFVFVIHFSGSTRVITTPTDSTLLLFTDTFGLVLPPAVAELGDQLNGTADIGLERLELLDADALLLTFLTPDDETALTTNPLFETVPAVADGGFVPLGLATATALREASILAIPFAAAELEDALTAALDR